MEQEIIKILKRRRESTFSILVDCIYSLENRPVHAHTVISGAVKRINLKFQKYKMQSRVEIIGDAGPSGKVLKLT